MGRWPEKKNEETVETPESKPKVDAATNRGKAKGFTGKCFKIRIYGADGESSVLQPFYAGTLGPFAIRRNQDVIVPEEVVEALRSANETMRLTCNIDDLSAQQSGKIRYWEEPAPPRFPFQISGEATWEEYEDFKKAQASKPVNP